MVLNTRQRKKNMIKSIEILSLQESLKGKLRIERDKTELDRIQRIRQKNRCISLVLHISFRNPEGWIEYGKWKLETGTMKIWQVQKMNAHTNRSKRICKEHYSKLQRTIVTFHG